MRTQREAIVTSSGGTSSASTTKIVPAGGSSIVFSSFGATAAVMRWNSSSTSTLRSPSIGDSDAARTMSSACLAEIDAPSRSTISRSGCVPCEREPGVTVVAVGARRRQERRGERVRRGALAAARRSDEQVGVHGVGRRGPELGDGSVLSDDFAEQIDVDGGALTTPDGRGLRPALQLRLRPPGRCRRRPPSSGRSASAR